MSQSRTAIVTVSSSVMISLLSVIIENIIFQMEAWVVMPTEYLSFLSFPKLHPEGTTVPFSKTKATWPNCSVSPALRPMKKLQDTFFVCYACAGTSSDFCISSVVKKWIKLLVKWTNQEVKVKRSEPNCTLTDLSLWIVTKSYFHQWFFPSISFPGITYGQKGMHQPILPSGEQPPHHIELNGKQILSHMLW